MSTLLPGGLPVEGEYQRLSYLYLYIPLIVMLCCNYYILFVYDIAQVHLIFLSSPYRANMCADNVTVCQRFTSLSVYVCWLP
jgi:hypothetical protein